MSTIAMSEASVYGDSMSKKLPDTQEAAAAAGLMQFNGKPCAKAGHTLRYTRNGACVACNLEHNKARNERISKLLSQAVNAVN